MSKQEIQKDDKEWLNSFGLVSKGNDERLKDPKIQEMFYEKLKKQYSILIRRVNDDTLESIFSNISLNEELTLNEQQHCLYLFRQLREGLKASERVDRFACECYETSIRIGIYINHVGSYLAALQHLLYVIYPKLLYKPLMKNQMITCYLLYLCALKKFQEFFQLRKEWELEDDISLEFARILIQNNYIAWWKLRQRVSSWLYQRLIDLTRLEIQEYYISL